MSAITEQSLLVAFTSFNRYTAQVDRLGDLDVARVMAEFYQLAATRVREAGGRVVKFIGDAMLAVFPEDQASAAVLALLDFTAEADRFMAAHGWDCYLVTKVHCGPVAAGDFPADGGARFDVLGRTVNIAARLESQGFALSAEAFRRLDPEARRRFKKHTPPVTYIRQEDAHRPRWAKRS